MQGDLWIARTEWFDAGTVAVGSGLAQYKALGGRAQSGTVRNAVASPLAGDAKPLDAIPPHPRERLLRQTSQPSGLVQSWQAIGVPVCTSSAECYATPQPLRYRIADCTSIKAQPCTNQGDTALCLAELCTLRETDAAA